MSVYSGDEKQQACRRYHIMAKDFSWNIEIRRGKEKTHRKTVEERISSHRLNESRTNKREKETKRRKKLNKNGTQANKKKALNRRKKIKSNEKSERKYTQVKKKRTPKYVYKKKSENLFIGFDYKQKYNSIYMELRMEPVALWYIENWKKFNRNTAS